MAGIPLNQWGSDITYKYHCKKCNGLNVWRSVLGKEFVNEPDLDNEIWQEDKYHCDDCVEWVDIYPVEAAPVEIV